MSKPHKPTEESRRSLRWAMFGWPGKDANSLAREAILEGEARLAFPADRLDDLVNDTRRPDAPEKLAAMVDPPQ